MSIGQKTILASVLAISVLAPTTLFAAGRYHDGGDRGARYDRRGRDYDHDQQRTSVDVRINIGSPPVCEQRVTRVWVEPVYQTVCDRVWIEPVYRDECERLWVPDRYELRAVHCHAGRRHVVRYERVLVERGHWESRTRRVLVCDGRWENVARQELVCAGHWEERVEQVRVDQCAGVFGLFARIDR